MKLKQVQRVAYDDRTGVIQPIGLSSYLWTVGMANTLNDSDEAADVMVVDDALLGWGPFTHLVRVEHFDFGGYYLATMRQ